MNMTFIFNRASTKAFAKAALVSLFASLFSLGAYAKDTPGATQTSYGVSASGAFQFSIPIVVPQGRNGVTPNLALSFSSGGGNGPVGVGWGLSGLSAITRCGKTIATHGVRGGVLHDNDDQFCMGGQPLILVDGTYGAAGSEYRTEIDGFAKIEAIGNGSVDFDGARAPSGWKLWTKDGAIYYYGSTTTTARSAQFKLPGTSSIHRWNLYRMQDRFNNFYLVSYRANDGLPTKVEYTFVGGVAKQKIEFIYEDRPDKRSAYVLGSKIDRDDRLGAIKVTNNGALLREYELAYELAPTSKHSRLTSVIEHGMNNQAMAPIDIVWKSETPGVVNATSANDKAPEAVLEYYHYDAKLPDFTTRKDIKEIQRGDWADVNGDGEVDLVIAYTKPDGGEVRKTHLKTASGWQLSNAYKLPRTLRNYDDAITNTRLGRFGSPVVNKGQLIDVNGDGLVDVVYSYRLDKQEHQTKGPPHGDIEALRITYLNTGSGWQETPAYKAKDYIFDYMGTAFFQSSQLTTRGRFVDINGDGLVDWITAFHYLNQSFASRQKTWINNGNGWSLDAGYKPPSYFNEYNGYESWGRGELVDLNGDGLLDWLESYKTHRAGHGSLQAREWINTGTGFVEDTTDRYRLGEAIYVNDGYTIISVKRGSFIDLNGDGRADFVRSYITALSPTVEHKGAKLNTGRGWVNSTAYTPKHIHLDYTHIRKKGITGDGKGPGSSWPLNTRGFYVDVNRDGLVDFTQSYKDVDGATHKATWLNTGSGWSSPVSTSSPYYPSVLFFDYGGRDVSQIRFGSYADINSDGAGDWVQSRKGSTMLTKLERVARPDQLASITTTLGVEVKPTFLPLTDNDSLYKKKPNSFFDNQPLAAAADAFFVEAPMYVTSELKTTNATDDGYNSVRYKYAGAQVHRKGRGFLGFHTQTTIQVDDQDPIMPGKQYTQATTGYHQGFPLTGRAKRSKTWAQGTPHSTVVLNETVNAYGHQARSNGTHFVYMDRSTSHAYDLNTKKKIRKVIRDLDYNNTYGNVEKDTTWVYDNTNKLLRKTVSDPVYKAANLSRWQLNQVASATTTVDDGPGGQPLESNSVSFVYANNFTGSLSQVNREPSNPDISARLQTNYYYDAYGNVREQRVKSFGTGAHTRTTKIDYGSAYNGRLPTRLENALGHASTVSYHPSCDAPSKVTDPNGLDSHLTYDNFCRQKTATDVTGIVSQTVYDDSNLSCFNCQTEPKFKVTSSSPGSADISTYLSHFLQPMIATTQGMRGGSEVIEQKTDYDPYGRVVRESQPYFVGDERHFNYYSYDQLGRVTQTELPFTDKNGSPASVENLYEMLGTQIMRTSVDVEGRPTRSFADALGQIKNIKDANAIIGADHAGIRYSYYSDGALKSTTDALGNVINIEYDDLGRRTKLIDPDLGTSTYTYNGFGELTSQTDNKSQTISMLYDKLSRLTSRTVPTIAGDPTASGGTSTWAYDTKAKGIGAIASITGPNGYSQTFNYDQYGRSLNSTTTIEGVAMSESVSYSPATGFLSGRNYPSSGAGNPFGVLYEYDNGYLSAITSTPDQAGDCVEHWRADKYDALGRTEFETLGKLVTTKRSFMPGQNVLLQIESILQQGAATKVQDLSYTYDGVNNLQTRVDNITALDERFEYDNLDRLTKHYQDNALKTSVSYDVIGNITSKSDVGNYSYGAGNAGPHAVTSITPSTGSTNLPQFEVNWEWNGQDEIKAVPSYTGTEPQPYAGTFKYDGNGSVTQIGNRNVYWTAFDKPYQMLATQADGSQKGSLIKYGPHQERIYKEEATYSYDSNLPLFTKQVVTEKTIYLGKDYERIEKKENGAWKTVHRYTLATGGNAVQIERDDASGFDRPKYLLGDNLGSTNVILNALGEVEQRLAFDPWGMRMQVPGSGLAVNKITNRGFTGHEMDDEVGLINMNARIYDPYLGRFLSADPVLPDAGDMQQFNRYSYVGNNPLAYVDPTGNCAVASNDPNSPCFSPGPLEDNSGGFSFCGGVSGGFVSASVCSGSPSSGGFVGAFTNNFGSGSFQGNLGLILGLILGGERHFALIEIVRTDAHPNINPDGSPRGSESEEAASVQVTSNGGGADRVDEEPESSSAAADIVTGLGQGLVTEGVNIGIDVARTNPITIGLKPVLDLVLPDVVSNEDIHGPSANHHNEFGRDLSPAVGILLTGGRDALRSGANLVRGALNKAAKGGGKFVFRGDTRSPSTIFSEGFKPRGTSTDLLKHARDNTAPPSIFVSTSKSSGVAGGFADNIFVVRPRNGIDVNSVLGRRSPFPDELEIAIPRGVNPSDIRGVTLPREGVSILNPNFKP